jgi:uncharacterized repeat protein (TIGR03803 family)
MLRHVQRFAAIVFFASLALAVPSGAVTRAASAPSRAGAHEDVLYAFEGGDDGAFPAGGLVADARGVLFGVTDQGGARENRGAGTVFKLTPTGAGYAKRTIHRFRSFDPTDGESPSGNLVVDARGSSYGTTEMGGAFGAGTVYKLAPSGPRAYKETVLYSFRGGDDGNQPKAGLIADASGRLYGTTEGGGNGAGCNGFGCGTVFKLTPAGSGYAESILYRFQGGDDGMYPLASLTAEGSGALFGTTNRGGGTASRCLLGCGTVFELTPSGSGYTERILYSFQDGAGGMWPVSTPIVDATGALYGTTYFGGNSQNDGIVFKLTPAAPRYTESVLYTFTGRRDGYWPFGGVIAGADGALYGTTYQGNGSGCAYHNGCGTVFKLTPDASGSSYMQSVIHTFHGPDGARPATELLLNNGVLYGATQEGGYLSRCTRVTSGCGTVFELRL